MPPLKDRDSDIELLIEFFRQTANEELQKDIARIAPEAIEILKSYSWPGNVRQLQSVIHQAVVQSTGSVLLADFLPPLKNGQSTASSNEDDGNAPDDAEQNIAAVLDQSSNAAAVKNQRLETANELESPETVANLIRRHRAHHSPTLYDDVMEEVERELLAAVLNDCNGNLTEAAKQLGITRTTVRSKVNKLGIGIRKVVE